MKVKLQPIKSILYTKKIEKVKALNIIMRVSFENKMKFWLIVHLASYHLVIAQLPNVQDHNPLYYANLLSNNSIEHGKVVHLLIEAIKKLAEIKSAPSQHRGYPTNYPWVTSQKPVNPWPQWPTTHSWWPTTQIKNSNWATPQQSSVVQGHFSTP